MSRFSAPASSGSSAASGPAPKPALRVGFLLLRHFTLSAFALFVDTLRLAADEGDRSRPVRAQWSVMSADGQPVKASCGQSLTPDGGLRDPSGFDYIVVCGGLLHEGQGGPETHAWLRRAAAAGVRLVGVCTGSFVLVRAGLMKGRTTCVSWFHAVDFQAEFPGQSFVADRLFLDQGDRITASGGSGSADLAAHIVRQHLGGNVAAKSLHVLQLQQARAGSEAQPHAPLDAPVSDSRVRRALLLMEQNIAEPLAIEEIAMRLSLSVRQLERLFRDTLGQKPGEAYLRLRLDHARFLLERTRTSITQIAAETGFCDGAHFSRQFKGCFGVPPSRVREMAEPARAGEGAVSDAQALRADRRPSCMLSGAEG